MKISIALATHNGARYINEQLDSFLTQTRHPDELVITDDCSTDDTLATVRRFAEVAPFPVIWSRNESQLGYGANFNASIQRTTGDLVFLSDQDDVWFPHKLARMVEVADKNRNVLVLINDAMLTDESLRETGLTALSQIRSAGFDDRYFVMGCCVAVRREWLNVCLPLPLGQKSHDSWIAGIAGEISRKQIVPEVLQYYRRHGKNESQWIVHRLTRVTRWHVRAEIWLRHLREWTMRPPRNPPTEGLDISRLARLEWGRAAAERAPPSLRYDLHRWCDELEQYAQAEDARRDVRRLPLPRRCVAALRLWRAGGYSRFSGLKSALRDVLKR
jgi:glycosyltransferase involved in cell wall biosynthesis